MFITKAYAQSIETAADIAASEALDGAPSAAGSFMESIFLVLILMVLFYVLLILPQQKRFKEHSKMLSELKKGDEVVTGGGLVGKIDKIKNDDELVIDLGNGLKVTALRSTVHSKSGSALPGQAANDPKAKKSAPRGKNTK